MKKFLTIVLSLILLYGVGSLKLASKEKPITITILFDNYLYQEEGLKSEWGFACLIQGMEKTILFDTGSSADIFLHNMKQLKVNPQSVDTVVISHNHRDHVGGLLAFLNVNAKVTVYMPGSAAGLWEPLISKRQVKIVAVHQPLELGKNLLLTGEIDGPAKEQALILDTQDGLIIITGCAHPGIVNMITKAKTLRNKKVYMVLGGFHLVQTTDSEVKQIISRFRELGVLKVGSTHCTGDNAIRLFKEAFGENYIPMGAGKVITVDN